MKVIGVTGGVGSGKSLLLHTIQKKYRCRIFFADEVAHLLEEPGQVCYEKLVQLLGTTILEEDGQINKKKMAEIIFSDQVLLGRVNEIVHPAVKDYIRNGILKERDRGTVDFCFVEAALFIEAGYRDLVDSLWYIYVGEDVRVKRLSSGRGYSEEKTKSIMEKQLKEAIFREACDVVIDNSGTMEETMEQVRKELENT